MNPKVMKNELTEEQIKELEMLATGIEAEAIQMKLDYETTGSEHSGSVVFINQDSPLLNDEDEEAEPTKEDFERLGVLEIGLIDY